MGAALSRRLAAVVAAAALLSTGGLVLATSAEAAKPTEASNGAKWLAGNLVDGAMPGMVSPDWGLTIDAVFALAATGADQAALAKATTTVAAHVRSYNSYDDFGVPNVRIAGATAKLLVAAVATKSDPADFGGFDLRQETLDLVAADGDDKGRVRNKADNDTSNTFDQSLAVIGLARSGGVDQAVVDFLIKQQCPVGGFRLSPDQFGTPAPTCAQATAPVLDPDSTGMAVQALLAADKAGVTGAKAAAEKGVAWLLRVQHADGSFGGSGPTSGSNTNSSGLAGQALAALGKTADADKAAAYVLKHQLTSGGIAYNAEALAEAADGIPDLARDQWRRATAQAVLGLAMVPLGDLGKDVDPPSSSSSTTTTTTTTTTTESTTSETTTDDTTTSDTTSEESTESTTDTTTDDTTTDYGTDTGSPSGLASTGASVIGLTGLGVLLLGGGGLVWFFGRRGGRHSG